jgi:GMP synthase (glutamine-hydrolysing)
MKPIAIIQHEPADPPVTIGRFLTANDIPWQLIDAGAGHPIPESLEDYAALIVMGGDMNVHEDDEYPFLLHERRLLERCIADQAPVLGICLGGQLLAAAAGARVYQRSYPEIGWVEVEVHHHDPLLIGVESPFVTMQWHDFSFTLPPGSVRVAARYDGEQLFRIGPRAWGLQFHPEVDATLVRRWLAQDLSRLEALRPEWPDEIRTATQVHVRDYEAFCGVLVGNFLDASGLTT